MHSEELINKVKNLPHVPGIYIYRNLAGKIIYVGKAKDLRNRVNSYFQGNLLPGSKTYALVQNISSMAYIEALSELEAIILEAALIKKHKPKYNISLKDDKSYIYLIIRNEPVLLNNQLVRLPSVLAARETDVLSTDTKFGPYPHGDIAKDMARVIRKSLPFRDCSTSKFQKYHKLNSPCLYGHMGLCSAPCTGKTSVEDYKKEIKRIRDLLSGNSAKLLNETERKMKTASKLQAFEEAAYHRDILKKFHYLRKRFKTANKYIENPYLVEDLINTSLSDLVEAIPELKKVPNRIECYDISTISGKEAVGSMVVATNGRIDKSNYRKFRIKTKNEPDDFAMLTEVLTRRLKRELSTAKNIKKWGMPDLIVIDGGKGQVSVISEVMTSLNVCIPLIGLAKRFETIVYLEAGEYTEVNLPRNNEGLKLIQRLRDEAHRFARAYHHKLRLEKLN